MGEASGGSSATMTLLLAGAPRIWSPPSHKNHLFPDRNMRRHSIANRMETMLVARLETKTVTMFVPPMVSIRGDAVETLAHSAYVVAFASCSNHPHHQH